MTWLMEILRFYLEEQLLIKYFNGSKTKSDLLANKSASGSGAVKSEIVQKK